MSILQNTKDSRQVLEKRMGLNQKDASTSSRDKIRLKMFSWFLENKKEIANIINENKDVIINWINYVVKY